jgi:hypothetical protein
MTAAQEKLIQAIGRELLACAPDGARPVLVYAEIAQDSHGSGVFYPKARGSGLVFKFGSTALENALIDLWSSEKKAPGGRWRAVCFSVEGITSFKMDFVYPDALDESVGPVERRQRFVEARFGKLAKKIDYSAAE